MENRREETLSEKKDVYVKAKEQMRLSERILAAIPGFHGYKEKELRRESDKLIRNHLYLKLSGAKNDLRTISQRLSDRRWFDVLTDMDRLQAKVDRVNQKVNHASYGYSGFFDVVKVKEENLDRMIEFDSQLVDDVDGLIADVDAFKAEVVKGEAKNAKERIQGISDKLEAFEEAFDKRQEVILGVT
jgi:outer membrane murein-binding lipoprotein Lpp